MIRLCTLFIVLVLLVSWGCIEIQSNNYDKRQHLCKIVKTPQGFRKATEYEYYSCIGK
jgi:hypothetical protein